MLSTIKAYLANQARKPSGWFGRIVAPKVFDKTNKEMEEFGLELMSLSEDDYILEIGFGQGRMISEIIPRVDRGKVCGIDISEQMVTVASKRNKNWIDNDSLEIRKASVSDIPYPEKQFDKVFTCNTIYFWPAPSKNINEVKRVLKPDGRFFCAFRDKELMESKGSAVTDNRGVFKNLYHPQEVKNILQQGGFQDITHNKDERNSEEIHVIWGIK